MKAVASAPRLLTRRRGAGFLPSALPALMAAGRDTTPQEALRLQTELTDERRRLLVAGGTVSPGLRLGQTGGSMGLCGREVGDS
jgi:hypothetical protein